MSYNQHVCHYFLPVFVSRRDKMSVEIRVFPPFFIRFFVQARKNMLGIGAFFLGLPTFCP